MKNMGSRRRRSEVAVRDLISISKKVAAEEMKLEKDPNPFECGRAGKAGQEAGKADEESGSRAEFRGGQQSCGIS